MEISASMGASTHASTSASQVNRSAPEAKESMSGPDHDGDRDDRVAVQTPKSTPPVNAMGETVGQIINVSA
jgi:hypothetical protein